MHDGRQPISNYAFKRTAELALGSNQVFAPQPLNAALDIMATLSEHEFKATFSAPMRQLQADAEPPFEFFSYFDGIPSADFGAYSCEGDVTYVWEDASLRYQHVLFNTQDPNVFMVVVLDLSAQAVVGHRLLDLNVLYGVNASQ